VKRREIFIELTSLLDVILIILFVVLTQARTRTADAIAEAEADRSKAAVLEQALADSREELDALRSSAASLQEEADSLLEQTEALRAEADSARRRLLSRELVLDNSLVATVSIPDRTSIRVETDGGGAQTISYAWEDDNYTRNALLSALRQALSAGEGQAVFLVFQYDRSAIYRAEYDMIRDVLGEIKLDAKQREIPLSVLELDMSE
jgi:biopolymer transport protein ExbD